MTHFAIGAGIGLVITVVAVGAYVGAYVGAAARYDVRDEYELRDDRRRQ